MRDVPEIRDVIVGNEPNLNRFWLPQFDADGGNVAAPAYLALLIEVYDAAKQADPEIRIWGGALAPRGIDRPGNGPRHPLADDLHPRPRRRLPGQRADGAAARRLRLPPLPRQLEHPARPAHRSRVDVDPDGRLRGEAAPAARRGVRAGPARALQRARRRDRIPAGKASLYEGEEPGAPVDEETQADFYRRAIELAACQENVAGLLLFHSHDEPALTGFQSGVYYVDGTKKESFDPVREALERTMCP